MQLDLKKFRTYAGDWHTNARSNVNSGRAAARRARFSAAVEPRPPPHVGRSSSCSCDRRLAHVPAHRFEMAPDLSCRSGHCGVSTIALHLSGLSLSSIVLRMSTGLSFRPTIQIRLFFLNPFHSSSSWPASRALQQSQPVLKRVERE